MTGNFMGDSIKGHLSNVPNQQFVPGLKLHRQIDSFTDSHPLVVAAKKQVSNERRRFAGIISDMAFDHFLACHWDQFYPQPLADFCRYCYEVLDRLEEQFPANLKHSYHYMRRDNWLLEYQQLTRIEQSLNNISLYRLKRQPNSLYGSIVEVKRNYHSWEQAFLDFYPQLIDYANQQIVTDH